MTRKFGFECEVVGGTGAVAQNLVNLGLMNSARLHHYHCSCRTCDPWHGTPIHAQQDCTVDGEFISKVLDYGSDDADRVVGGLALALRKGRAVVNTQGGFHVHVDARDLTGAAKLRLWRMFLHYQENGTMGELAAANFDAVRSHNGQVNVRNVFVSERYNRNTYAMESIPNMPSIWEVSDADIINGVHSLGAGSRGEWLWNTEYETFEFRLWNATLAEWRMRLAIGVSVAMVNAAVAGVNVTPRTRRPLESVLAPFLDERTWAGIIRQRYTKGGIAA